MSRESTSTATTERQSSLTEAVRSYIRDRYESIRFTVRRDMQALRTVPGGPWTVIGAALGVAVVFSLFRIGIDEVYTESIAFLLISLLIGLFGWTPGVLFVVAYGSFDLIGSFDNLTAGTFVGRVILYVVLFALVVSIPSAQRTTHIRLRQFSREHTWMTELTAPASAIITGGLVWLWTEVVPYLIRPVFTSGPPLKAVAPLQRQALLITGGAGVLALIVGAVYQRQAEIVQPLPRSRFEYNSSTKFRLAWISRGLRYVLVIIGVSGLVTNTLDVVLLVGALIAADLLVPLVARLEPIQRLLLRIPRAGLLLLAVGMTFVSARYIMNWRYEPFLGSEFFPLVLSLAVGLFVFRLLLDTREVALDLRLEAEQKRSEQERTDRSDLPPLIVLVVVSLSILLAIVPGVALAHDCSGLNDCEDGAKAGTAAGLAGLAAGIWGWVKGVFAPMPPVVGELEPLLSEEGAKAQRGAFRALREKVAKNVFGETGDYDEYRRIRNMSYDELNEYLKNRQKK